MLKKLVLSLVTALFVISPALVFAQKMIKETPVSLQSGRTSQAFNPNNIIKLSVPDVEKALKEDTEQDLSRFALPVACNIPLNSFGDWEVLENGDRLWKISLEATGSKGWILWFDDFELPAGSKLFVYNENGGIIKGAYSDYNNKLNKKLTVGPVSGSKVYVEYYEPKSVSKKGQFTISKAFYVYKASENAPGTMSASNFDPGYLTSFPCMININCPEGDNFKQQKKSVVRILLAGDAGYFYCTGSLMNNTKKDSTPYILSGYHCEHSYTTANYDNYIFYFNWETPGCNTPLEEPKYFTLDGCEKVAGREESDFILYKMADKLPKTLSVYYNGWNKNDTKLPSNLTMIHHPQGDVKKISLSNQKPVIWNSPINWNNGVITPAKNHWRVTLTKGASQGGSSGAPIFDEKGMVVGQLNGGNSTCNYSNLFYGRLSKSWNDGATPDKRLKEWLDPLNTGTDSISGIEVVAANFISISGTITSTKNIPVQNVKVTLSGGADRITYTDEFGKYTFDQLDPLLDYSITPSFDTYPLDGVSVADMSFINRHILGVKFLTSEFKKLAADVNESDKITTADMSIINKLIQGKEIAFPSKKNWIFVTPSYKFNTGLANKNLIKLNAVEFDSTDNNFYLIKFGDVSGTN